MPLDKIIEIDGDRFYSEVVVRKLLRKSAALVNAPHFRHSFDFWCDPDDSELVVAGHSG